MTAPTFSPARVAVVVVLALLTAFALGIFAGNSAPTSSEVRQFGQACATRAMACAPGVRP